jgi:uncharacterized membrane protein
VKPEHLALLAAGAWSLQALGLRAATRYLPPVEAVTAAVLVEAAVGVGIVLAWPGRLTGNLTPGLGYAGVTGLAGMAGFVLLAAALRATGHAGVVTALGGLYPVPVIVVATLLLGEPLTMRKAIAAGLAVAAVWLAVSE